MKRIAMAILCTILLITGLPQGFLQEAKASSVTGQEGYTGIRTINGKKYCFKNGRKVTGMQKVGDDYYFFSGSAKGAMDGGWKIAKGHFRYFDKKTGKMQTNRTINGRKVNSQGIWTPVVVLDPGHSAIVAGGYEPLGPGSGQMKAKDTSGTQGVVTRVEEYKLNLTIAKKLNSLLEKKGYKVILTRTNNKVALSCKQRAEIANKAKADAFVRIHANGSSSSSANGAMTICTTKNSPYVPSLYKKSKALSTQILNAYVKATGCKKEFVWETDSMSGNNWSKVPATIIEMGYMSNPTEDRKMQTASYQKRMVAGIANGIDRFIIYS